MNAVEIVGLDPTTNAIVRTRHYTPEGVLTEYQRRAAQGQANIHKETVTVAPWAPETCTKRPKHRQGGNHAQH